MRIQLTEQEQNDLIFQQGDYFEIVPGIVSVSLVEQGVRPVHLPPGNESTLFTFFIDCLDKSWGTFELQMFTQGRVPEGPALVVLYRRGQEANPFGVIGMGTRASVHLAPILSSNLIGNSTKAAEMKKLETKSLLGGIGTAMLASALPFGLGKRRTTETAMLQASSYREVANQIEGTLRSFMHRLVRSADQYWQGGGGSTTGKL